MLGLAREVFQTEETCNLCYSLLLDVASIMETERNLQ